MKRRFKMRLMVWAAVGFSAGTAGATGPVTEAWVRRYHIFNGGNDVNIAKAVAVNAAGDVYVTGWGGTAKFRGTDGVPFHSDTTSVQYGEALALDAAGRPCAAGWDGTAPNYWWTTARFNPNLVFDWYKQTGPVAGFAHAIAVDAAGNICVTGELPPTTYGKTKICTIKYNPNGGTIWQKTSDDTDYDGGIAVAVDAANNVYVAGTSNTPSVSGIITLKYDSNGSQLWVRYDTDHRGIAKAIALDASGNVHVLGLNGSGSTQNPPPYLYTLLKYDTDGNPSSTWPDVGDGPGVRRFAGANGAYPVDMKVDAAGNVYATGHSIPVGNNDYDMLTVKYGPNGAQQWVATYPGVSPNSLGKAMALDTAGNVYVTGHAYSGATGWDVVTVKYGPNGAQQWDMRYNNTAANGNDEPWAITVDASNHVFVVGNSSNGNGQGSDYLVIKYVQLPPVITQQPAGQAVCAGGGATFTVAATGASSYQWRKNGVDILGATGDSFTIAAVTPSDAGDYGVVVTGSGGGMMSNPAMLVVNTAPAITAPPLSQTVNSGDTVVFTAAATGTPAPAYQWRKGGVPLSDDGHFSGTNMATLTINNADFADNGVYDVKVTNSCGFDISDTAALTVAPGDCPPAGAPYDIHTYVVTGDANNIPWSWRIECTNGRFVDAFESHVPGVATGGALEVAQAFADNINSFAAAHGCDSTQLLAQARTIFGTTVLSIRTGGGSTFQLWVGPDGGPADCLVLVNLPACTFNPTIEEILLTGEDCNGNGWDDFIDIFTGDSQDANGDGVPDECADRDGDGVLNELDNCPNTANADQADCDGDGIGDVCDSDMQPHIGAQPQNQTACEGAAAVFSVSAAGDGLNYQWRRDGQALADDDRISGTATATLVISLVDVSDAGGYDVVVSNGCGQVASGAAALTVDATPTITQSPLGRTVKPGRSVTFTVAANGTGPLAYQWRKDGMNISGATGDSFTIAAAQESDEGAYDAVVTNACGEATSAAAFLTVGPAAGGKDTAVGSSAATHLPPP